MFYKKLVLTAMFLVMVLMGCMSGKSEMEEVKQGEKRATSYVGSYKNVYFRGTPNSWGTTDMTLVADYTWQTVQVFGSTSTERFKIDVSGNWATSYPTADYVITGGAGAYTITFNDKTKVITVVKGILETLTIGTTSSTINQGDTTFVLPATGTLTKDGTTSSVNLTWSPVLDLTTIGTKVYTGTASETTQTVSYSLTVSDPNVKKTLYSSGVWLRGTSNSWGLTAMELTADYTRTIKATFGSTSTERFKIDVSGNWTTAYPTGDYAITGGAGTYTITFNEQTKVITVAKAGLENLTISTTSGTINQGDAVFVLPVTGTLTKADGTVSSVKITWSPALDVTTIGTKVYTGTASGTTLTVSYSLTVKAVTESLTIGTTSGTINKGDTFTLPTTGTLTKSTGTTSTVKITWSPVLDITTIGTKVYTGTASETTQTVSYSLTVKDPNVKKTLYSSGVWLRGTSNSWGMTAMELTGDYTRTVKATFGSTSTERFKIDVSGNWTAAYPTADYLITEGAGTYTVTFNEQTKAITAVKVGSESLTINTNSSTINKGDTFNLPTTAIYKSVTGTTSSVKLTWSPALDITTVGTKVYTGTASETSLTVSYSLTVVDPNVKKTMYSKGVWLRGTSNSWGLAAMELTADYTRTIKATFGSTSTERFKIDVSGDWATSYPTADYVITNGAGTYTITFNEQTKAITAVKEVIPLSTLTITSSPNKSYYFVGDSTMDLAGLVVTGTYSNGTTAEMAVTMSNITGFTTSAAGVKTITVTVGGKSATFNITVNEKSISGETYICEAPIKKIYYLGETKLDLTGIDVSRYYTDEETGNTIETKSNVAITDANVSGFTTLKTGVVPITVTYDGKSSTFNIIVVPESNKTNRMLYVPSDKTGITAMYVGKYEVTQGEYLNIMGTNPSYFAGKLNNPVESITWYEAIAYCNALSRKEGLQPYYKDKNQMKIYDGLGADGYTLGGNGYRLPKYAERVYFAGDCGRKATHYPGSDDVNEVAWSSLNSNKTTHEVGMKKPNNLDIYDLGGNVMEMVDYLYQRTGYVCTTACAGGDWRSYFDCCASDDIFWKVFYIDTDYNWIGFRVVRNAE